MTATAAAWDSDPLTPPDGQVWDLLVIGGGSAGLVAAKTAARFGATVLLVERDRTGGDCLWSGCVPSKALLAVAHLAADARRASRYGVHTGEVEVDFAAVMQTVRGAIATIEPADSPATLRAAGVSVARADARFTSSATADLDGVTVRFRQALIATGSQPLLPPIPGLAQAQPLTSDTLWSLDELPARLLVLGGGSIGCELGQAFARLGAQVTVVEAASQLLPREDPDAAAAVAGALTGDGVDVRTGVAVTEVLPGTSGWSAMLADGSRMECDRILVAVGRRPRSTSLSLDAAGVAVDGRGYVRVDASLRTSNRRIWAAGDITGHPQFTHTAGVHGSLAAGNAILGLRRRVDLATLPRVTFTQPEVAAFGATPGIHPGSSVITVPHTEVDRAIAEDQVAGFSRLILDRKGRLIGAGIVGPRAGESLAEPVLAARHGLRARDLAGAIHAYPTFGDGVWKAGIEQVQHHLRQPGMRRVIGVLHRIRRWWTSRG